MERFFSLEHLTVDRLRDLYRDALKVGKLLIEYDRPGEEGHRNMNLPEDVILKNISADDQNCFIFHEDDEDYTDAIMIAFPLKEYSYTTAYIDIDNNKLDWFVEKYALTEWWQKEGSERKYYPFSKFYTLQPMKRHRWN